MPLKRSKKHNLAKELNEMLERLTTTYKKEGKIDKEPLITAVRILSALVYDHEFRFPSIREVLTDR